MYSIEISDLRFDRQQIPILIIFLALALEACLCFDVLL